MGLYLRLSPGYHGIVVCNGSRLSIYHYVKDAVGSAPTSIVVAVIRGTGHLTASASAYPMSKAAFIGNCWPILPSPVVDERRDNRSSSLFPRETFAQPRQSRAGEFIMGRVSKKRRDDHSSDRRAGQSEHVEALNCAEKELGAIA